MNNVSTDEVKKFSDKAAEWWDEEASFAPLHQLNKLRLAFICEKINPDGLQPDGLQSDDLHLDGGQPDGLPLSGLRILDIGCGGGLLAEPLARLGAEITAIDASAATIEAAKAHARQKNLTIDYRCQLLEELGENLDEKEFDVVLAMEIVEHVPDVESFIARAASKIKPKGQMFLSTINRTPEAFLLAIIGAEYVLQKLPKGTHEFNKFVRPQELQGYLQKAELNSIETKGAIFNPLTSRFFLSNIARVNYMMAGRKNA